MKMLSGIYILDFNSCIKIGRSKDIHTRLKSYNGHRDQDQIKKLLLVFTPEHKYLEKQSHQFASRTLERKQKYEKFVCSSQEDKTKFIEEYRQFLLTNYSHIIDKIVDQFDDEPEIQTIKPLQQSNLLFPCKKMTEEEVFLSNKYQINKNTQKDLQKNEIQVETSQGELKITVFEKLNPLQSLEIFKYNPKNKQKSNIVTNTNGALEQSRPRVSHSLLEQTSLNEGESIYCSQPKLKLVDNEQETPDLDKQSKRLIGNYLLNAF